MLNKGRQCPKWAANCVSLFSLLEPGQTHENLRWIALRQGAQSSRL